MKAKEIKPLCSWEERRPIIEGNLFFIPKHFNDHKKELFPDWNQLFSNPRPVCIEYCSGNGAWLIERAEQQQEYNFIGVEKRFDRVRKIVAKAKNLSLNNLFTVWGEGFTFTRHYLAAESVDKVFINFPDPWPKRRHGKNRLLGKEFILELSRILIKQGSVTFVTDDQTYLEATLSLFLQHKEFAPFYDSPYYVNEMAGYGSSYFEDLWRTKGKMIYYLHMVKR